MTKSLRIKLRMPKADPLRIKLRLPKDLVEPKPCINLPEPVQMSFMKETDADFSKLFAKLETNVKDGMDEEKRRAYEDCSFVTTHHQKMRSRLLNRLLSFLQQNEAKYSDFLKPYLIGNESVPMFFHIFAGDPNPGKKACFNAIMKDWILNGGALLKVGTLQTDECKYYKPSTFITYMKSLASELNAHNIHFNILSGFEGKGEFGSLLKEEWARLIETYPNLAVCDQKRICDEDINKLYDLTCFNEDVLWDHQLKCIVIMGCSQALQ